MTDRTTCRRGYTMVHNIRTYDGGWIRGFCGGGRDGEFIDPNAKRMRSTEYLAHHLIYTPHKSF